MSDQGTCDPEIFQKGKTIVAIGGIPAKDMEEAIGTIRTLSEQSADWHYIGGWAVVKTLGDPQKVKKAIKEALPESLWSMNWAL